MSSTTYEQPSRYHYDQRAYPILWPAVRDNFANGGKMGHYRAVTARVHNAGQLPQPFWLGAACGGGSHNFSASVARA
nr:MAG TPA: hypothetical protein [Caudoviricetes sp.]